MKTVAMSKPGLYASVGAVSMAVVVGGVIGYRAVSNKPKPVATTKPAAVTTTKPTTQPAPAQTTQPKVSYAGTYTGSTSVAQGIAGASATVGSDSKVTGTATYNGPYDAKIPITITGTVNSSGAVSGNFSGSAKVQGFTVNVSGTFKGNIVDKTVKVNYTASAAGVSASSSITLTKQ